MFRLKIDVLVPLILSSVLLYAVDNEIEELFTAIENNNSAVVMRLIKNGANINVRNHEGDTPLIAAVLDGNIPLTQILLQYGAQANTQEEENGDTALHLASFNRGDPHLAELLIRYGANIEARNNEGDTPLISAVLQQNVPFVEVLLQHGADMYAKNAEGRSPFDYANKEISDLLQLYASTPTTKGALLY
jgi:ankyrin repeat protein